jgi:RNA polymerase sigma-70 factor (ECF subfamily)
LRRRRRRGYVGPWLPSPIETEDEAPPAYEVILDDTRTTEGRYELLESVSYAFLLALEALTPQQRAILLLRDVFDYSVEETAEALDLTAANVKTSHHRARSAMEAYDRRRSIPSPSLREKTRQTLERFMAGLVAGDAKEIEALLAEDVRVLSDGGGEFHAARVPVVGRERVARFYRNITRRRLEGSRAEIRMINGLPALVAHFSVGLEGEAARVVTRCEIDDDGRIREIHAILATRKLTAIA